LGVRLACFVIYLLAVGVIVAEAVPLPRPRPPALAPAAVDPEEPSATPAPSVCRLRLTADIARAPSVAPLTGPGECTVDDVVRLEAVVLADKSTVAVTPPALMRCSLAEAIAHWVRDDVAPAVRSLHAALVGLDNYASYDCRGRNRQVGATLSEHGKANALDMRSLRLTDGRVFRLTDPQADKVLREELRARTCARFATVLGPGSDGYHEDHVHVDLAERRNGMHLCHWEVREPGEALDPASVPVANIPLPRPRPSRP
jgi:hypothetical protein